jgi:DMSO/TMAO reductase YedYZ molybdopterin-dependent catalytic subunit
MLLMGRTLQVRTVPERWLEAVLLVTPPSLFEAALQQYGFDAKRYGLALSATAMLIVLSGLGAWTIWRRWSDPRLLALAGLLWLSVMVVLMPLTGAGPFGLDLIHGTKAAIGAHLAAALAYAAVLASVSLHPESLATASPVRAPRVEQVGYAPTRRSALLLSAGAVSALVGTFLAARWGPKTELTNVIVVDSAERDSNRAAQATARPATRVPSATPDLATRPPAAAPATAVPAAVAAPPTAVPTLAPTTSATATPELEPPPIKRLSRDQGGVALASGRRPGELAAAITDADDFYIVSKNPAQDPFIERESWRLRVDGDVERPIQLDYRSLRNLPPVELAKTLECISNFVTKCELAPFGCDLISTANWKGARLGDVLALAGGLKPGVTSLLAVAADELTTTLPIDVALDPETLVVYEMNGSPLAREHGYPARILVPGRYGMKNAKWVIGLRPLQRDPNDWYGQRSWTRHAIVKTMTRIDAPARGVELPPGQHRIAGIAYAGDRGVAKVEVSADGGDRWQVAQLLEGPTGRDVWARWESSFMLPAGATLTLLARATDGTGELQVEPFSLPQPDGSTGWHSIEVRASA